MNTTHRIVLTDEYVAQAQRLSIAQNKMLKFIYRTWWSWWLPRVAVVGLVLYLVVNNFDWSIPGWLIAFLVMHAVGEWLGRRRLAKMRKKVRSDDPITVTMDENGVDVVGENGNSHSNWTGMPIPLIYPHGVLLKFSRLSGIWLPDQALIEGSAADVRKLLTQNVKNSETKI